MALEGGKGHSRTRVGVRTEVGVRTPFPRSLKLNKDISEEIEKENRISLISSEMRTVSTPNKFSKGAKREF